MIGVLIGFAIATLLMNTPAAIVGYFAYSLILPIAVGILGSLSSGFADVAPWIEFNTAQTPLFTGDYTPTGEEWAQIAVSGTIWLVDPAGPGHRAAAAHRVQVAPPTGPPRGRGSPRPGPVMHGDDRARPVAARPSRSPAWLGSGP